MSVPATRCLLIVTALLALTSLSVVPTGAHVAPSEPDGRDPAGSDPANEAHRSSLVPGARQTRGDDVIFTLTEASSTFGPETYKGDDRFNTRNAQDFQNQSRDWTTSLGHAVSFLVQVQAAAGVQLACDERFDADAYIMAPSGRLWGWTNGTIDAAGSVACAAVAGVRTFNMTFDVDGAPSGAFGEAYPALPSGLHQAHLDLYYVERPTADDASGRGPLAGSFEITFAVSAPQITLDRPAMFFPDGTLRLLSDVGGGDQFPMPTRPYVPEDSIDFNLSFFGTPAGHAFEMLGHYGQRIAGGGVEPPIASPPELGPGGFVVDRVFEADDRSIQVVRARIATSESEVPASRTLAQTQNASAFRPSGSTFTPLYAVSVHIPMEPSNLTTGAATVVLPIRSFSFPIREVVVQGASPGAPTGATSVRLLDAARVAGGTSGNDAGDLFAMQDVGFGHDLLGRTAMVRDADGRWVRGQLDHVQLLRGGPVPSYDLLAMVHGAQDEFFGLEFARRGIELASPGVRAVEAVPSELQVTITSLSTDFDEVPNEADFGMTVLVSVSGLPDGSVHNTSVQLTEAQGRTVNIPLPGGPPGDYPLRVTATSAELQRVLDVSMSVISREQFDDENRAWYSVPAPGLLATLLLLVGAARLHGRRP